MAIISINLYPGSNICLVPGSVNSRSTICVGISIWGFSMISHRYFCRDYWNLNAFQDICVHVTIWHCLQLKVESVVQYYMYILSNYNRFTISNMITVHLVDM